MACKHVLTGSDATKIFKKIPVDCFYNLKNIKMTRDLEYYSNNTLAFLCVFYMC